MIDLLIMCVVLGVVAYLIGFLELPDPYAKLIRVLLILILIVAVLRFAFVGRPLVILW